MFHRLQSPWHFTTPKPQPLGLHHYYLHQIYNLLEIDLELVNARVTAANWYWLRRGLIKHHYIVEVDDLPVIHRGEVGAGWRVTQTVATSLQDRGLPRSRAWNTMC